MQDIFPPSHSIASAMFAQSLESHDKLWNDLTLLSAADHTTFWTIAVHSSPFPRVLASCLSALTSVHPSDRKLIPHPNCRKAMVTILLRLVLTAGPRAHTILVPRPSSVSSVLSTALPPDVFLNMSSVLARQSALLAAVGVTSFVLQCPSILSHLPRITSAWSDELSDRIPALLSEAKAGRFQRRSSDIVRTLEEVYRAMKALWTTLHACPFLVPFISLTRVMGALCQVVDTITPLLQHFVMCCDALTNRRSQLTRATTTIVNCAIEVAYLCFLMQPFHRGIEMKRKYVKPKDVARIDERLVGALRQHTTGAVRALMDKSPSIVQTFDLLFEVQTNSLKQGNEDVPLADFLFGCFATAKGVPSSQRFGVQLLSYAKQQGVRIENLVEEGFIDPLDAERLGLRVDPADRPIAQEAAQPHAPAPELPVPDAKIQMVLEVLPHLNPAVLPRVVEYYNGDIERLINDGINNNLPPHLMEQPSAAAAHTSPKKLEAEDEDDGCNALPQVAIGPSLHRFLSSDYHDAAAEGGECADDGDDGMATARNESTLSELFTVDDEMAERIKQLMDIANDDEYDDAQDELHNFVPAESNGDDEEEATAQPSTEVSAADATAAHHPQHANRSSPPPPQQSQSKSYEKKPKSVRVQRPNRANGNPPSSANAQRGRENRKRGGKKELNKALTQGD